MPNVSPHFNSLAEGCEKKGFELVVTSSGSNDDQHLCLEVRARGNGKVIRQCMVRDNDTMEGASSRLYRAMKKGKLL